MARNKQRCAAGVFNLTRVGATPLLNTLLGDNLVSHVQQLGKPSGCVKKGNKTSGTGRSTVARGELKRTV